MVITLIAALARGRLIGSAAGRIPWDIPRDREHFRAYTAGKWLLVGRLTYEEMDGWFGERIPLVLTEEVAYPTDSPAHRAVSSVSMAIALARDHGAAELVVCGGASVYALSLPLADRLILTRIDLDATVTAPVRFPDFETDPSWQRCYREIWVTESGNPSATLEVWERVRKGRP